jgi:hypothetical protein
MHHGVCVEMHALSYHVLQTSWITLLSWRLKQHFPSKYLYNISTNIKDFTYRNPEFLISFFTFRSLRLWRPVGRYKYHEKWRHCASFKTLLWTAQQIASIFQNVLKSEPYFLFIRTEEAKIVIRSNRQVQSKTLTLCSQLQTEDGRTKGCSTESCREFLETSPIYEIPKQCFVC